MSSLASRQSSVCSTRPVVDAEHTQRTCFSLTIPNTLGPLAVVSMLAGGTVVCFGFIDIWNATRGQLQITLRRHVDLLKSESPHFDGGLTYARSIWYAAATIGAVTGFLQVCSSFAFLVNVCRIENPNYIAKMWIVSQSILSFVLLTIVGAVFIGGFSPDWMIFVFGADFVLINLLMLGAMPVIRTSEKEPAHPDDIRLHGVGGGGEDSVFGAFLLFSIGTSPLLKNPMKILQSCVKCCDCRSDSRAKARRGSSGRRRSQRRIRV